MALLPARTPPSPTRRSGNEARESDAEAVRKQRENRRFKTCADYTTYTTYTTLNFRKYTLAEVKTALGCPHKKTGTLPVASTSTCSTKIPGKRYAYDPPPRRSKGFLHSSYRARNFGKIDRKKAISTEIARKTGRDPDLPKNHARAFPSHSILKDYRVERTHSRPFFPMGAYSIKVCRNTALVYTFEQLKSSRNIPILSKK